MPKTSQRQWFNETAPYLEIVLMLVAIMPDLLLTNNRIIRVNI